MAKLRTKIAGALALPTLTIASFSGLTAYASSNVTQDTTKQAEFIESTDFLQNSNLKEWGWENETNEKTKENVSKESSYQILPTNIKEQIFLLNDKERAEMELLLQITKTINEEQIKDIRHKYKDLLLETVKNYPELVQKVNAVELDKKFKVKTGPIETLPLEIRNKLKDLQAFEKALTNDIVQGKSGDSLSKKEIGLLSRARTDYLKQAINTVKDYPEAVLHLEEKFNKREERLKAKQQL